VIPGQKWQARALILHHKARLLGATVVSMTWEREVVKTKRTLAALFLTLFALLAAGCSSGTSTEEAAAPAESAATNECAPGTLQTLEANTLTIATGEPAFSPWVLNDAPEKGEGFEAAVAYAVAKQLSGCEQLLILQSLLVQRPLISISSNIPLLTSVRMSLISRALITSQINPSSHIREARLKA